MPAADFHSLRTVRDLIRYAVSRFNAAGIALGHGTLDVYDEAVYLVLHTLHLPIDRLEPFVDAAVLDDERAAVLAIIDRRIDERLPAPYLTNEAWLRGRRFYVDERVIVPRSYIAELLDDGLAPWVDDPYAVEWALDMCTGSGCLAIAAAETFPHAQVDAVDISQDALDVARINVDDYGLQDRVALHQSNLFEKLPPAQYDLILCNLPTSTPRPWMRCRRNTGTSPAWRWRAARTAWTSSGRCWRRQPISCSPTASWCWSWATRKAISSRPFPISIRYG